MDSNGVAFLSDECV